MTLMEVGLVLITNCSESISTHTVIQVTMIWMIVCSLKSMSHLIMKVPLLESIYKQIHTTSLTHLNIYLLAQSSISFQDLFLKCSLKNALFLGGKLISILVLVNLSIVLTHQKAFLTFQICNISEVNFQPSYQPKSYQFQTNLPYKSQIMVPNYSTANLKTFQEQLEGSMINLRLLERIKG